MNNQHDCSQYRNEFGHCDVCDMWDLYVTELKMEKGQCLKCPLPVLDDTTFCTDHYVEFKQFTNGLGGGLHG